jgi:hypothetical protein
MTDGTRRGARLAQGSERGEAVATPRAMRSIVGNSAWPVVRLPLCFLSD